MKNFNDINNDYLYLSLYDYRGELVAEIQKWFYELVFYKRGEYPVYGPDGDLWHGYYFDDISDRYRHLSRFKCGFTRKRELLSRYGHRQVKITFENGKTFTGGMCAIPCLFNWKYLLNHVKDIIDTTTGECIYIGYKRSYKL